MLSIFFLTAAMRPFCYSKAGRCIHHPAVTAFRLNFGQKKHGGLSLCLL